MSESTSAKVTSRTVAYVPQPACHQGLAFIAFADDSNDFAAHSYVTHQIAGYNLNTGKTVKIKGANQPPPVATTAPQVYDFRHDARAISPPPVMPDADTPVDILTIGYGCQAVGAATWITATMTTSGLNVVPPVGTWRMRADAGCGTSFAAATQRFGAQPPTRRGPASAAIIAA